MPALLAAPVPLVLGGQEPGGRLGVGAALAAGHGQVLIGDDPGGRVYRCPRYPSVRVCQLLRACRDSGSTWEMIRSSATVRAIRHRPSVPSLPPAGDILPGGRGQQRQRRGRAVPQLRVPQRGHHRARVVHQRGHQLLRGLGIAPADHRAAALVIVEPGAPRGDHPGRARHLPHHPPHRRDQLRHRVLRGDRVPQDRGIHRPPPPSRQDPRRPDDPPHRVIDPVRPPRPGHPPAPDHQRGRMDPRIIQAQPARQLPPQVKPHRLGRLPVQEPVQCLQRHDRRHPRRPANPRPPEISEQVRPVRIREHLTPVTSQEREHPALRHQMAHQGRDIPQPGIRPLETLHNPIIPANRTHSRQAHRRQPDFFSRLPTATWLGHPRRISGRQTRITSHGGIPGAQEHQGPGSGPAQPAWWPRSRPVGHLETSAVLYQNLRCHAP